MEEINTQRPRIISALYLLLIAYGFIIPAKTLNNILSNNLHPEIWPLIAGFLSVSFISAGLAIASGIAVFRNLRWGWWLAGIFLCSNLLGGILGFIQLFIIHINEQALYKIDPVRLYSTVVQFIATFCLLLILFTHTVREHLHVLDISIKKYTVTLLGYSVMLLILNNAITILASYLDTLIN